MVCPITSELRDAEAFRLTIEPTSGNRLRQRSQAMLDKVAAAPRDRCGPAFGALSGTELTELTRRIVALLGA
jgi:mRNA interferase MazF